MTPLAALRAPVVGHPALAQWSSPEIYKAMTTVSMFLWSGVDEWNALRL
jgi:hypothetical protein